MPDEPVDLTTRGAPAAARLEDRAAAIQPHTEPYDPSRDREETRGRIAMYLVWTLIILVAATFVFAIVTVLGCAVASCNTQTKDLEAVRMVVQLLLTPIVGLVGAVAGFYFGEKSGKPG
ncbi:MAG TPA: hypothetical protein VF744_17845 [Beijerinckiaceae bacterium]